MRRTIGLWLFVVCAEGLCGPAVSQAAIVNGPNVINAKHSGKCLTVSGGATGDGAQVIQSTCDDSNPQQFSVVPSQDAYQIIAKHSGKCLGVSGSSTADGAQVVQGSCLGGDNQLWYAQIRTDHFQLVAKHSGKCLNVDTGTKKNGARLTQWACLGADRQRFAIAAFSHTPILAKHSRLCLDVNGGSSADGARITQWTCHGKTYQQWTLMPYHDAYRIVVKGSRKCMTVSGASVTDGAQVVQQTCGGANNELWYPQANGRQYTLVAKHSGKCLTVQNGAQAAGAGLIQSSCGGGDHQLWQIDTASTTGGKWSAAIPLSLVPSAAANLPNGKILLWSSDSRLDFDQNLGGHTYTSIFDPATKSASERLVSQTGHNMFCPGTANLADGRILVNGGIDSTFTSMYSSVTDSWSVGQKMNTGRGYEGDTVLTNGEVFTIGGSWSGGEGGKDGEVWNVTNGWRRTPGIIANTILTNDAFGINRSDNHPWLFTVGEGKVFHAGPSKQMNWFNTGGTGSSLFAGFRGDDDHSMNGNAVMYDVGKILKVGGAPDYKANFATTRAYVIDLNNGVTVNKVAAMAYARSFANSVVLPNGEVLVFGGQSYAFNFDDVQSVLAPELWNPVTKTFTTLVATGIPRNYHSVAILMPDGRVFVGGSGLCGACETNHANAEIFTPPYLLNADGSTAARPTITSAPASAGYGTAMTVSTDSPITRFALVRLSSATHSVNNDQRRIPLSFEAAGTNVYSLSIPSDRGVAIPGYYMLFGMNSAGVPSVAKTIKIG
ncbi:MAG: RICIN domain-containing protein [Nitrospira sp.]|nr:RICIN domain-containing protein [Nitrospira sp.]